MAMQMLLGWGAKDSTLLLNTRFKEVFKKGFATGGVITTSGSTLEATVSPFVLVTSDGCVATSDASVTLPIGDGVKTYIVVRARYRTNNSPILVVQALSAAAFGSDPEAQWLHVVATLDLTTGTPHSFPPASSVSYTERDEIDQQGRSFWRDPVPTLGDLPQTRNRHGDTRLVTDTGSLHWWNENTSVWEIFDEVPLTHHRQTEHSNGLVARSVSTSLQPGVTGTNVTVQAVPAGSGYTVDGRFVAAPSSAQSIAASTAGSNRGIIQLGYDQNGASTLNYRVGRDADALDLSGARLLDISDGHPLGTFSLVYDPARGFSWGGGEPAYSPGVGLPFKLKNSAGTHWISISFTGAFPVIAVSDNYIVNASLKDNTHFLVGHWFWDGSSVLVLGADKRVWGNLGYKEMSSDFKRDIINAVVIGDSRRDGVISGGELINDLGSLSARIVGPIVAVVGGTRFVVDGAFSGAAFPPSAITSLFISQSGVLTQAAGFPSDGSPYAAIADVTTNGSNITTIDDRRYAVMVAGNHEGSVSVVMGKDSSFASRNHYTENKRVFETRGPVGDVENTLLSTGILEAIDGELRSGGPLNINDGTNDNLVNSVAYPAIANVLPGASAPSLVEAIVAAGEVASSGVGVVSSSDFAVSTSGLNITLSAGVAYTFAGMKLRTTTNTVLAVGAIAPNTTAYVYLNSLTKAFVVSTTKPTWKRDIVMAVFQHNGAVVNNIVDTRPLCDGTKMGSSISIGFDTGNFQGALALRSAVAFICAYTTAGVVSLPPAEIVVVGDNTGVRAEQNTVDLGAFYGTNLDTLSFRGSASHDSNSIYWGASGVATSTPLFNLRGLVSKFKVRDLEFVYAGDGSASDNLSWVKDPNRFDYNNVEWKVLDSSTGFGLRHLQWRSLAYNNFREPSKITNCNIRAVSGTPSVFHYTAASNERITLDTTTIAQYAPAFESAAASLFQSTVACTVSVSAVNCALEASNTWFNFASTSSSRVVINGGELLAYGNAGVMGANVSIDVVNAKVTLQNDVANSLLNLAGVSRFEGVDTVLSGTGNSVIVEGAVTTRFNACDLDVQGRFRSIDNSTFRTQTEIQPATTSTGITQITASTISRVGGGRILNVASGQTCVISASTLTYTGALADDPGTPAISIGGLLRAEGARLIMSNRTSPALSLGTNGNVVWRGGAVSTSGGRVTEGTPTSSPSLDLETSGILFDSVEFFVGHIPDVSGVESYAFSMGAPGTPGSATTTWFNFFRMTNCRARFDTPYWFGIYQTSKVEVDVNRITAAASNNVITSANQGESRIVLGDGTAVSANVSVGALFQQLGSFSNNTVNCTRTDNVGLAKLQVAVQCFHSIKTDNNTVLCLSAGTAVDTLPREVALLITPHFQGVTSRFASIVSTSGNKLIVFTNIAAQTQSATSELRFLGGLGGGANTAGSLALNNNTLVAHCSNTAGSGTTTVNLDASLAVAAIAQADNNTGRAHPNATACQIRVPTQANTYAGTSNLLNDGAGTGTVSGTFVEPNTAV